MAQRNEPITQYEFIAWQESVIEKILASVKSEDTPRSLRVEQERLAEVRAHAGTLWTNYVLDLASNPTRFTTTFEGWLILHVLEDRAFLNKMIARGTKQGLSKDDALDAASLAIVKVLEVGLRTFDIRRSTSAENAVEAANNWLLRIVNRHVLSVQARAKRSEVLALHNQEVAAQFDELALLRLLTDGQLMTDLSDSLKYPEGSEPLTATQKKRNARIDFTFKWIQDNSQLPEKVTNPSEGNFYFDAVKAGVTPTIDAMHRFWYRLLPEIAQKLVHNSAIDR